MNSKNNLSGLIIGIITFVMWGFFPIYFKLIQNVSATEILAHRVIWACVFLFLLLRFLGRLKNVRRIVLVRKAFFMLMLSGAFIALNWGVYIWAINNGQILESSLGYFINPLMSMLLGALILKEHLNLVAKFSIFIVFCAVCIQIYALGSLPIISLILPASFAIYGLIKKKVVVPAMEGLFIETLAVSVVAFAYVGFLQSSGEGHFGLSLNGFLLFFSGVVTILPLITFNMAANRLRLSTLGFLQYISPTMQAILAVVIYGESLDSYKVISFVMIWLGILIVSIDAMRKR